MRIDISALLRGEVDRIPIAFTMVADGIEDVSFTGEVTCTGEVCGNAGYTTLTLTASVPYVGECARCLDPVCGVFETEIERVCVTEGAVSREELEENEDEYLIIREGAIDPEQAVNDMIFFEFPHKLLCDENCTGICQRCGKKHKEGEKCPLEKNKLDSRFAILEKVLDNE